MNSEVGNLRVNVSLLLDEPLASMVEHLNLQLGNRGSEIRFGRPGDPIAHITMLMGFLRRGQDLPTLLDIVDKTARFWAGPINFEVSQPVYATSSSGFVFLNIIPEPALGELRTRIFGEASEILTVDHHGGPQNPPHITIGYLTRRFELSGLDMPQGLHGRKFEASRLQIARTGARGTCTETIREYSLIDHRA